MNRPCHIEGWTLAETLVTMIVAGVVFLALMDGLLLFNRYTGRKAVEITGNMRLYEGHSHLEYLAATSDSLSADGTTVTLYRHGKQFAELSESDSLLVVRTGSMHDTLMYGVAGLGVYESPVATDSDSVSLSVSISEGGNIHISFPVRLPVEKQAMEIIREHEKQFAYE